MIYLLVGKLKSDKSNKHISYIEYNAPNNTARINFLRLCIVGIFIL